MNTHGVPKDVARPNAAANSQASGAEFATLWDGYGQVASISLYAHCTLDFDMGGTTAGRARFRCGVAIERLTMRSNKTSQHIANATDALM